MVFKKEVEKLNKFINEMNEELHNQTLKLNLTVEKAEISFQQYELLYYEISSIKKNLLEKGKLITKEKLNKIIQNKKPNEAIYLLMNMFVKVISQFEQKEINNNLSWEYIINNISFSKYSTFLLNLSKSGSLEMNKQDLEEAMPFLVNYEKLETPVKELGEEYLPILIFIKISVDYNIKLNIIKDLYNSNLNKNKKINSLQIEVNKLNNSLQKILTLQEKINNEFTELCNIKDSKEELKKLKLILLKKYNLSQKYNVYIEINNNQNKEKFIIKLNNNYKHREKFIEHLLNNSLIYLEGKNEEFNESLILYLMNDDIKDIYNVKKFDYKNFKISNKKLKIENYFSKFKLKPKIEKNKNEFKNKTYSLIYNDKNKYSNLKNEVKTIINKDSNSYLDEDNNITNKNNLNNEYDKTKNYIKNNQQRKRNIPSNIKEDSKFCNYFCCKSFN